MNDDQLRLLIRAAIQRHVGGAAETEAAQSIRPKPDAAQPALTISFGQYRLERAPGDTECIIEPAVQCNHCGFCKCHGH